MKLKESEIQYTMNINPVGRLKNTNMYRYLAAIPIPAFIILLAILTPFDNREVFNTPWLLPIMNTIFVFAIYFAVAYICAKSYLAGGSPSIILLGCGMLALGSAALSGGWLIDTPDGVNVNVTLFNIGALFGSIFHLMGAMFTSMRVNPELSPKRRKRNLKLAYPGVIILIISLTIASLQGIIPQFFIQGTGATPLRQVVLGTAALLFAVSAFFFMRFYFRLKEIYLYWYSLAMMLVATNLFSALFVHTVSSLFSWAARLPLYLGGIYFLNAIFIARRTARTRGTSVEEAVAKFFREPEENFQTLVETANDAIISFDNKDRLLLWNSAAEKIFSYNRDEAIGSILGNLIIPASYTDILRTEMENLTVTGKSTQIGKPIEMEAKRKDGKVFPVEFSISARKTSDGWIYTGIIRDITRRKRTEERIDHQNAIMKGINRIFQEFLSVHTEEELGMICLAVAEEVTDSKLGFIGKIQPDGLFTDIAISDPGWEQCTMYDRIEHHRLSGNLHIHGIYGKVLRDGRGFYTNDPSSCPDSIGLPAGHPPLTAFLGVPLIHDKHITGIIAVGNRENGYTRKEQEALEALAPVMVEVFQRKEAEEALHRAHNELELRVQERTAELNEANKALIESEASYRKLTESIDDPFVAMDSDLRYIYWNKACEAFTGILAKDAIGKYFCELFPDMKGTKLEQFYLKALETQQPQRFDSEHQSGDKKFIFEINAYPTKTGLSVIIKDITEKRTLEAHLLRAQRMESIGILTGGMAHNLNNMLTPIMLSLQILKEKFKDEQSQKMLSILENNSQRSADLIKQVLSFSRGIEGERVPLDAKHLITEVGKIAKETFPRNIEIRTDIRKDLLTISGDATQLHQVLMNLGVNARDAMPNGGILDISAENLIIDENYARMHTEAKVGSYITITVSDTGTGIASGILDRIFEPFFTTKEFGKGTGLGLSTALAIIRSHGGFINVNSEVGKGTRFMAYLPAIKTEMQNTQEQKLELFTGHGELILIAEDEDSVREITISTLEKYGYKVLCANNGADAVVLYVQNKDKVKIVLMDMMMPIMDGQASIQAIHKINPEVKVIAVSGLAEKDKLAEIASSYTKAFLPKPYTAEKLLKIIYEVMIKE